MNEVSQLLGIAYFMKGRGSSVYSPFVDAVLVALGLDPTIYPNKYRRVEAALLEVGQTYDPATDSSEHRGPTGGGTVTNRALEKLVLGLEQRTVGQRHRTGDVEPRADPYGPVRLDRLVRGSLRPEAAASRPAPLDKGLSLTTSSATASPPPKDSYDSSEEQRAQTGLDKWAEKRAVHIAKAYLANANCTLVADRQKEGVGYDLEFDCGGSRVLVEVKGIQSNRIAFNMTRKEWDVAEASANYLVIAVTDVLSPDGFSVHSLGQAQLFEMRRRIVQYRLSL